MADGSALLKLAALDAEDLTVVSAQLQDAILKVGDIDYLRRQQKLVMIVNRFDWESAEEGRAPYRRCLAGVQFTRVRSVKSHRIMRESKDGVLELLAITFEPKDDPAGDIMLTFAGGGTIRLSVECIEVEVKDLGPEWVTPRRPAHDDTEAG
jgi:hypothetical protein